MTPASYREWVEDGDSRITNMDPPPELDHNDHLLPPPIPLDVLWRAGYHRESYKPEDKK